MKGKSFKIFYLSLIFMLVFSWIFSGWPKIYNFPPQIQKVQAAFTARTETTANSSSQTSPYNLTVNTPGGVTNGDVMFLWAGLNASTIDSIDAAWISLGSYTVNSDKYYLYYKIANNEPASYTVSAAASGRIRLVMTAYSAGDWDSGDPIDVVSNTAYRTSNSIARAASMNVAATSSPLVFFGALYNTSSNSWTKPANIGSDVWVDDYDSRNATSDFSLQIASMIRSSSGATGNIDATNSLSSQTTKHAFAVALKPISAPTVSTQSANPIGDTTATCNGTITATGGQNATAVGCEWDTDTGAPYTNSTSTAGNYGAAPFTQGFTGLPSGTTIYTRAFATNSVGTGYGGETSFLTKPAAPTGLNFTSVTATTLRLNWNSVTGAASYKVERCTGTGCSSYSEVATGVTNVYWDDSGRIGNTVYRYQVRATNTTGDSAYSSGAEQLMLPDIPGTPTFTNIQATSLTVNWTVPTGDAASYKVERCQGSGCSNFSQIASGVTNIYYDDSSLAVNTLYRYQIRATNNTGDGSYSNIGEQQTSNPTVSCSTNIGSTSFGALTTSIVTAASPNASTTMSCTYSNGCTLSIQDSGNGSSPGLATTSPAYLISSADATLSIGTEGYGIQATTTASGSGGTLDIPAKYNKTGYSVGGFSIAGILLASSTAAITNREIVVTHLASIASTTQAGSYTDTITYSCTGNP